MFAFRIHPQADAEAIEAASWIKTDDPVEAGLFVTALEQAIDRARRDPESHRILDGEFRRVIVGKFRYSIVYRFRDDEVQIVAVIHHSRRPGYWRERAGKWKP